MRNLPILLAAALPLASCADVAFGTALVNSGSIGRIAPLSYPDDCDGWAEFCGYRDGKVVSPLIGGPSSAAQTEWAGDILRIHWHTDELVDSEVFASLSGQPSDSDAVPTDSKRTWRGITTRIIEIDRAHVIAAGSGSIRLRIGPKRGRNRTIAVSREMIDALEVASGAERQAYCFVPGLREWMIR